MKNKIIILLLSICNFMLVLILLVVTTFLLHTNNNNIEALNTSSAMENSIDTNTYKKYKYVEVHYGDNKAIFGLIGESDVSKVDTPHTKIYCYQIEEINTDDIDSITVR